MSSIKVLDEYDVQCIVESVLTKKLGLVISDGFLHLTLQWCEYSSATALSSIDLSELKEALNDTPS